MYKSQSVFFMETKLNKRRMDGVCRRCRFLDGIEVSTNGSRRGLCLAWKELVVIDLLSFSTNYNDVTKVELEWRFTGFYGAPFASGRSDTWDVLRNLRCTQESP
ncbi:Exo_endo_phos domain-containing protein [Gossypium australe]|uniref:Exo_endo_phos domain-containing protein n=1 Tax=Gossypium australe TaxID=47621 RepID=A0A5B6UW79_9ROSI|nr:Exo_endo_phos domain-containing protein [Gossypium australe]